MHFLLLLVLHTFGASQAGENDDIVQVQGLISDLYYYQSLES